MKKTQLFDRTDSYLISEVKKNASSEAFQEICRRYENLFYKVCHKYSAAMSSRGLYIQDIFNEKNNIIFHCVQTFKSNKKTKLSSHIGNYARFLCLNSMNDKKLLLSVSSEEAQKSIENHQICNDFFNKKENLEECSNYIINILSDIKDPRIKKIFEYRYLLPKKMIWNQIAKKMNTTPQTIISLHKKGLVLIKNKIKNNKDICDLG